MSDPRVLGLGLMAVATIAFLGTTSETLPAATFFPALLLFVIGAFKFLRQNRSAMAEAEERAKRAVRPGLRENRGARSLADRQTWGPAGSASNAEPDSPSSHPPTPAPSMSQPIEIDLEEDDLQVGTDVSFPLEAQKGDALADQLTKLNRLLEQGVLTEEEYAIAKAKLLG